MVHRIKKFMRQLFVRTAYVLTFAFLLLTFPAQSQIPQGQNPGQGQGQSQAVQLSPEQISAAAQAYVEIQELREQYRSEYGSLSDVDSTKAAKIQAQFRQETQQTMKEAGISQQKFSMVMQMAPANENIKQQFFAAIKEAGGQPPQLPNQQQRRQQQQRAAPQVDVSDEQLQEVAEAFVSIQELRQQFQQEHGSVQDSTKMQQLQKKFQAEAQQAIQDTDVSQQLFSKILRAARSDAELRKRFFAAVEEAGGEVPSASGQPGQ